MKLAWLSLAVLSALAVSSQAQIITGLSGTIEHVETVVIGGLGFGAKSQAAPYKYDSFDAGTDGEVVTGWSQTFSGRIKYSTAHQRRAGSLVAFGDFETEGWESSGFVVGELPASQEFYISGWWYNETGGHASRNFKLINFTGGTFASPTQPQCRTDMYPDGPYGHLYTTVDGESVWKTGDTYDLGGNTFPGSWQRIERYINVGTFGAEDGATWVRRNLQELASLEDVMVYGSNEDRYDTILITHYFSRDTYTPTPWMRSYWDELYIDTTLARVEIGNASTWDACTHREIQIPTAWAADEITVTINQGSFAADDDVWFFVVDADGSVSGGYPATIGGSGGSSLTPDIQSATRSGTNAVLTWLSGDGGPYTAWLQADDVRGIVTTDTTVTIPMSTAATDVTVKDGTSQRRANIPEVE